MPKEDSKDIEQVPRKLIFFFSALVLLILFGTISFCIFKGITPKEGFVRTLEALVFIFHEEAGAMKFIEIFLGLIGVLIVWWAVWNMFDLILEGCFTKYLKSIGVLSRLRRMKNHYIIAGGGRVGEEVAKRLKKDKKGYVIIEKDVDLVDKLTKKGYLAFEGDVSEEEVLKKHNLKDSMGLILALPELEKNLMVTMSAKSMSPSVRIYARADKPLLANRLKEAGADFVVVPEVIAAEKIVESLGINL